jgi:hypothetical protein
MVAVNPSEHPLLYRAILSPRWLRLRKAAFRLRGATEFRPAEKDLSVLLFVNCTKADCDIPRARDCRGEFVLKTEDVIADRWLVEKDEPAGYRSRPKHAGILGLPPHGSEELLIELASSRLAKLIDRVQPRPVE